MIETWLLFVILSVVFLVLELFTPVLFFINLAFAAVIAAYISYIGYNYWVTTIIFLLMSIAAIVIVRPLLLKNIKNKEQETGMTDKYIGKTAKVIVEVTKTSGRVALYGEEWNAVTTGENIPVGENVKIVSNESIILTVEKEN